MIDLSCVNTPVDDRGMPGVPSDKQCLKVFYETKDVKMIPGEGFTTIPVDRKIAHVIMGGLAIGYSEGQTGIVGQENLDLEYDEAERRLVRVLYAFFPDLVKLYSWLPHVTDLIKEEKIEIVDCL